MDKQPPDENTAPLTQAERPRRKLNRTLSLVILRLLLAFAFGWSAALLTLQSGSHGIVVPFFLCSPLIIGILAAVTVKPQTKSRISLAMATGLLALIGIYVYLFPMAILSDAQADAYCAHNYCHVGGISTFYLNIFFLLGMVAVLLGVAITSLFINIIYQNFKRD